MVSTPTPCRPCAYITCRCISTTTCITFVLILTVQRTLLYCTPEYVIYVLHHVESRIVLIVLLVLYVLQQYDMYEKKLDRNICREQRQEILLHAPFIPHT